MFEILKKEWLTREICLMDIYAPNLAQSALPGHFLIVRTHEKGERIPLTVCDYDREKNTVTIVFQVLGESTVLMGEKEVGDTFLDVAGPLGHESELTDLAKLDRNKNYLFVAGGVGTAPVYPQVKWMKEQGIDVDVIIGTRSKDTLILEEEMRREAKNLYVCTDDGSYGIHGRVTDVIRDLVEEEGKSYDEIVAIGPLVMMKFVAQLTKEYGIKTVVSLNPLMIDGTGMCGACRVSIGEDIRFACVDGPEFDGHLVDFDEAMRRQQMYKTEEGRRTLAEIEGDTHHSHSCGCHEEEPVEEKGDRFKRVPIAALDAEIRVKNFEEVCLGYTEEEAIEEANRCLECKNAKCIEGCPVSINIPEFIGNIKRGKFDKAAEVIFEASCFPAICGRVCPQETQCEERCVMGVRGDAIAIGKLEKYVGDYALKNGVEAVKDEEKQEKVAVVGSGPAGLAAASELAKMGYKVRVYEALHEPGGVLTYGIPEFRLPKHSVVEKEIENIKRLGVEIVTNALIGRTFTVDELLEEKGYSAVFIASGAGLPNFMGIPGENSNGVFSANEFLTRVNLMKAHRDDHMTPVKVGEKTVVIGGGNVAMDAARTAARLGSKTHVVYRRSMEELPARLEEVHHAQEEGIIFDILTNPVEIIANEAGWVEAIRCVKMELGEADSSGRRRPVEIPGSEFILETSSVIMAIGTKANELIPNKTEGLEVNRWNCIVTGEDNHMTTKMGVFAGGDAVTGAATVILAMEAGKKAAVEIDTYIKTMRN
ncbi:2-polyprenylphenol hydroxylase [Propionigenium maris DSM 9537]|uniref:2-polyprenylphenol hydroxylase n=1 Tax=Propionigenium maris DSM 9537 TaxID=1123000 RepID=A0A9W6GNA9_9FUSO|nr:NADPH-dependent glutamate synthase [Propionigenium maris]GLI58208.1 2-polyprenylphenol hydroxylase [Propionigenium maris DSM 9537]